MRTSIIVWSTASGVVLGVFVDALLIGGALIASSLAAHRWNLERLQSRWVVIAAAVILTAIPIALSILGYLEGELKAA